jgi:hypothetical protein
MFGPLQHIVRRLAIAVALVSIFQLEPQTTAAATSVSHRVAAAGVARPGRAAPLSAIDLAASASGGYRFPLGLKACALSIGTAIAGLAMVSVAPLGALNAFTAGMLSMLYTCS